MKKKDKEKEMFTVFPRKASASAWAPSGRMRFRMRLRVVRVCKGKFGCV